MIGKISKQLISIDHMIDDRLFEPQRLAHSYIEFDLKDLVDIHGVPLGALAKGDSKGNNGTVEYTAKNILRLAMTKHGMPSNSSEEIVIQKGNEAIKFAGGVSFDNLDLSFTDWIGADIERVISAWDGLRYNPMTGCVNPAYKYKRTGTIVQYSPDGEILRTWTLRGCWINGVKYGEYDRSSKADHREISMTLHIDKGYPDQRN